MTVPECPFCHLEEARIWLQTDVAVAFLDKFPVSPGHTLVIPEDLHPKLTSKGAGKG